MNTEKIYADMFSEYGLNDSKIAIELENLLSQKNISLKKKPLSLNLFHISEQIQKEIHPDVKDFEYKFKHYDDETIAFVVKEIRYYGLTNKEAGILFKVSRNTLSKWLKKAI